MSDLLKYVINKSGVPKKVDYLLVLIAIALSGIAFFTIHKAAYYICLSIIIIAFFLRKSSININFIYIVFYILIIAIFQAIKFSTFNYISLIGQFIILTVPYLLYEIMKWKLIFIYIELLYYLSFYSLIVYFLSILFPDFFDLLWSISKYINSNLNNILEPGDLIVYKTEYWQNNLLQNTGVFYEHGVAASHQIFVLVLNTIVSKNYINKKNTIFLISLLTGFSTAGYAAVLFFTSFYFFISKKWYLKFLIFPLLLAISFFIYKNSSFLEKKIVGQYRYQIENTSNKHKKGRFYSNYYEFKEILENPFFGRGIFKENRVQVITTEYQFELTGTITNFWLRYGTVAFLFLLLYLYKLFRTLSALYSKSVLFSIFCFISILIAFFGTTLFTKPIFLAFIYFSAFELNRPSRHLIRQ